MLHWQHKSVNRIRLWLKLALVSLVGHVAALAILFFVYRGSMSDMALTVRAAQLNSTIDVVWVPGYAYPGHRARQATPGKSARNTKEKKAIKKTAAKSGPKTELKSEVEEKKKTKKKEKKSSKPSQAQAERDKKKQLEEKKKLESKKAELEKKKVEEKKKPEVKNLEPEKKPELEKSIDAIADSSPVRPCLSAEASCEGRKVIEGHSDEENLNFEISGSYRDLEALQQFQELQQEISRCWRPPVGIAQTVCCQIKVTFDWEGKVTHMETVKPSGILMFDVSSRNAVAAMEAPKFVRGKTFTITFKP